MHCCATKACHKLYEIVEKPAMNRTRLHQATIAIALLGLTLSTSAQTIYRIMGADGKVTFSDKPPNTSAAGKASASASTNSAEASGAGLPFELRQATSRFPVTLYSGADCAPCADGRAMLVNRGIPFTERSVKTPEDAAVLLRTTGETTLPLLVIGQQHLKGYSQSEWMQTLDAAGFPPSSQLPPGYKFAAATPLAPPAVKAPATTAPDNSSPTPQPLPAPSPANPAGIQF
jgi:glutaredoxin